MLLCVFQNEFETVTKEYITDYLSVANRDILVTEKGSYVQRYVYDNSGSRISVELDYAEGTNRANGEGGANPASDFAANATRKVWYRRNSLGSSLYAVNADSEVIVHMSYDVWGSPTEETYLDMNLAGIDNLNNFTGYTYDETLRLYYAQNRFYDAENRRFTQQDPVKDGVNWYAYCGGDPVNYVDPLGLVEVGLREYAESHGATVDWNSKTRIATITYVSNVTGETTRFQIAATKNNLRNGRIYVDDSLLYNRVPDWKVAKTYKTYNGREIQAFYQDNIEGDGGTKYLCWAAP